MKRTSSGQFILPGANGWELWRADAGARAGSPLTGVRAFNGHGESDGDIVGGRPAFLDEAGGKYYGFPSSDLTTVALWIQVPESETEAAVKMQLEGRGIRPSQPNPHWSEYRIAKNEGGRRLAVISGLGANRSELDPGSPLPQKMRPAADFLPFRPDRVTLYRELNKLVIAVTQGGDVVYHTPLVTHDPGEEAACEIVRTIFQLKFDGVVGDVAGLDAWVSDADVDALSTRTGLSVDVLERPGPVVPGSPPGGLETADITERRQSAAASVRVRKMALVAGAILALVVFVSLAANYVIDRKREALLDEIAGLTPRAAAVATDMGRWEAVSPAVDRDRSALEIMRRLSLVPSVRGVTLTKFELAPGSLTVGGKAGAPGPALKFGGEVTAGAFLPGYRWEFPAPAIAGDNSAVFELKGKREGSDET